MTKPDAAYEVVKGNGHTQVVEECAGPDELGHCPKVSWGDVVPCAGNQLRTRNGDGIRVVVPDGAATCPIPAVQPRKRSVWMLAALVAMAGAVAGAAGGTLITLAVARGDSTPAAAAPAAAAKPASAQNAVPAPVRPVAPTATVTVPGDRFEPAFLTVASGTTVTWKNADTDEHSVTTVPGLAPAAFDLDLQPGAGASFQFTVPGLYVVYCKEHAVVDSKTGLIKPLPGTDVFPEAMTETIAVTGPAPAGAPAGAVTVGVPGDRYAPSYLTVKAGATVTWNNTDSDPHSVTTVPGFAPAAFDLDLAPGGTASYHFTVPGLYIVYCKDHATLDTATGMLKPIQGTDVYPEVMAGAVLVQPAS